MKLEILKEVSPFTMLQLETCTRCAHCAEYCPVYDVLKKPQTIPGGRVSVILKMIKSYASPWFTLYQSRVGKLNEIENYVENVYQCASVADVWLYVHSGYKRTNFGNYSGRLFIDLTNTRPYSRRLINSYSAHTMPMV